MSVDSAEFDTAEGTGVTIPRKAAVFGGGAILVLLVIWLLSRNKGTTAGTGLDTSGNGLRLTPDQYNSLRNDFLNGPWSSGADNTSAGNDNTSPPGGADIQPTAIGRTYKAGDVYPANGETLDQIAAMFGDSADHFYYGGGNDWIQRFLTNSKPDGGGYTKRGTVGITGPVHIPHTATKIVAG